MLDKLSKKVKIGIITAVAVVVLIVGMIIVVNLPSGKTEIDIESALKEVFEISDLSTVEYSYSTITKVFDTSGKKEQLKYYVKYKGKVRAGIDFSQIKILKDENSKKYYVCIPEIKINSSEVEPDSLSFIFMKKKYDTETVFAEAKTVCENDLAEKAKSTDTITTMGKENAIQTVKALITPFESQLSEGWIFEVTDTVPDIQEATT